MCVHIPGGALPQVSTLQTMLWMTLIFLNFGATANVLVFSPFHLTIPSLWDFIRYVAALFMYYKHLSTFSMPMGIP